MRQFDDSLPNDQDKVIAPAPWARVPVDAQFLAEVFDAFCGADGYNLVAKIAMERLKGDRIRELEKALESFAWATAEWWFAE